MDEHLSKIIEESSRLTVPQSKTKEDVWKQLSEKIDKLPQDKQSLVEAKSVRLYWGVAIGVAASIAIVALYFGFFSITTISTKAAEHLVYSLPDGSSVTLNADSKIEFKKMGWKDARSITLEGEAFFEVQKGSEFTVNSARRTITVLGTSFNVSNRQRILRVACFSGKVRVNLEDNEAILEKDELIEEDNTGIVRREKFNAEREASWRRGEFYFEGARLGLVIDELERQFNIEIVFNGDPNRLYTGYFNNQSLDEAMILIFKPMALKYRKEDSKVIIE